jgi:hypothetical protein
MQLRMNAASFENSRPVAAQISNGDEADMPASMTAFTKGMPHTASGEVDPAAYQAFLHAMSTGLHADFESMQSGWGMELVNPESAFAYQLEGADSHCLATPPPPAFTSATAAAEMVELYWHALARDIPFTEYDRSPLIQSAARELTRLSSFQGPRHTDGTVSAASIFRGAAPGALQGPYISQFLWKPVPTNSTWTDQRYRVPVGGSDYLTSFSEWSALQNGLPPYRNPVFDDTPRYIYNGRGLAEWVHYDFLYQAFHHAALILVNVGPESILSRNPYWSPTNPYKNSKVQTGFVTFGAPHICGWLGRVTTAALGAAWYQKWSVHMRLRPEEFGGRLHQMKAGPSAAYSISPELAGSEAVARSFEANGSYLLPQAFPEGCPLHPSYPSGHATVSGACSALLKAFFDEDAVLADPVVASHDGLSLVPYRGAALTVGGEIDKLAYNVAIGRNFAGIHYRSDATAGLRLGEDVAIAMMQDLVNTFTEDFAGFAFTRLDGTPVQIKKS